MSLKKQKVPYYDYSSLYKIINPSSGIGDILIFDDINIFVENFHLSSVINFPIRMGLIVGIICKKGYLKMRIDLEDYVLTHNMILVIFPQQIFELIEISSDFKAGYVLLEKHFFDVQNDFKMALDLESYFLKQNCVQLPEKDMEEVMNVFEAIKRKVEEDVNLFSKEIVQTYIRILFYIACNILLNSKKEVIKTRKGEVFEKFISLLAQNFCKEQKIGWYAEKFCISPKYLSKLVYEASGKHASDWIKDYIILEVKALLSSSSLTVQQISDKLGFANQSHFGTYFKRNTGVSPREYKQHLLTHR